LRIWIAAATAATAGTPFANRARNPQLEMAQSLQSAILLLEALQAERRTLLAKYSQLCELAEAEHSAELNKDAVLAILHAVDADADANANATNGESDLAERLLVTLSDLSRLHDQIQPMAAAFSGSRTARRPST
jgi:hypothetical protein